MAGGAAPGWGAFGKMPALGDFFRLGIAADFVAAWDPWLQAMLVAGRAGLNGGWEAAYMSAPLWRFALAPGVAGASAMTGVLMPSVDRVGRQFPLTLACPVAGDPLGLLALGAGFWHPVEDLALNCLDDAMTREALEAGLTALPRPELPGLRVETRAGAVLARGPRIEAALAGLVPRHGAGFASEVEGEGRLILAPALPGAEAAASLFEGGFG